MNIEQIADRIQEQTDEQIEVARMIKEFEADEHFSGYFQEYLRDLPKRIGGLDADDEGCWWTHVLDYKGIVQYTRTDLVPQWVSVDERLPERSGSYLIETINQAVEVRGGNVC